MTPRISKSFEFFLSNPPKPKNFKKIQMGACYKTQFMCKTSNVYICTYSKQDSADRRSYAQAEPTCFDIRLILKYDKMKNKWGLARPNSVQFGLLFNKHFSRKKT